MNLLLLNAASGNKLEQALEKLVDFGMDAGKEIGRASCRERV